MIKGHSTSDGKASRSLVDQRTRHRRLVWRGSARTARLQVCSPGGGWSRLGYLSSDLGQLIETSTESTLRWAAALVPGAGWASSTPDSW
jgi:hypothetical protein